MTLTEVERFVVWELAGDQKANSVQYPSTFEVADATHGGEDSGLHFNVPDAGLMSLPQILQLLLGGERAQSTVQSALACVGTRDD